MSSSGVRQHVAGPGEHGHFIAMRVELETIRAGQPARRHGGIDGLDRHFARGGGAGCGHAAAVECRVDGKDDRAPLRPGRGRHEIERAGTLQSFERAARRSTRGSNRRKRAAGKCRRASNDQVPSEAPTSITLERRTPRAWARANSPAISKAPFPAHEVQAAGIEQAVGGPDAAGGGRNQPWRGKARTSFFRR